MRRRASDERGSSEVVRRMLTATYRALRRVSSIFFWATQGGMAASSQKGDAPVVPPDTRRVNGSGDWRP